jgi:voltage-gated potassium channel
LIAYDVFGSDTEEDLRLLRVRLAAAAVFLVAVTVAGTVGYRVIDPSVSWVDAFYMTAITLTTVGYGEIIDLDGNPGGRIFTAALIIVGMGGVLYFVTTATAFVVEGHLGHVFRRRKMEKNIRNLSGHLIVCGWGSTAVYTTLELLAVQRQVVLVCEDTGRLSWLDHELPDVPKILGDPTRDAVLEAAGAARAVGLVACTDSDKENLVISLSARQLNPNIRIVSRVVDIDAADKIRQVGADAIVSPAHIGGLRLASELIRPTVVSFLDLMLRDKDQNLRVDEVSIPEGSPIVGMAIEDLKMGEVSNALLMAYRSPAGDWHYNPEAGRTVEAGSVLILMGTPGDIRAVCDHLGGSVQARPSGAEG